MRDLGSIDMMNKEEPDLWTEVASCHIAGEWSLGEVGPYGDWTNIAVGQI